MHSFLNYRLENGVNINLKNERNELKPPVKDFVE